VATARAILRMLLLIVLLFAGLVIELFVFPFIAPHEREACIQYWSFTILRVVGVRLRVRGPVPIVACQIAANHSSWLDILTINSVQASQFVAKAEIRRWPVVGLLVARAGTHFIERSKRRAVHSVLQGIVKALQAGRMIAVFPEGTTNDGRQLLPFHANLMQAAIDAAVPLKPLAISYRNSDGKLLSEALEYVGDTTFMESIWRVMQIPVIHAELIWGIEISPQGTRHELCREAERQISALTGLPQAAPRKGQANEVIDQSR
jgi:1-acyl-sn-glycerol-3-phosphate acyltransferase